MRMQFLLVGALLSGTALAKPRPAVIEAAPVVTTPATEAQVREQYVTAGQNLLVKGDFDNALRFFERALVNAPNHPDALVGAGDAMLASGKAVDSTKYYQAMVSTRPADPRGYVGLARAFNTAYRPADALAALAAMPAAVPKGLQALIETGIALDLSARTQQAQKTYSDALKIAPRNLDVLRRMAISFALSGDYPAALSLLNKVAAEPDGVATIKVPLSMVYGLDGQIDAAMRIMGGSDDARVAQQRRAFFQVLSTLSPTDKARALHFNYMANDVINTELARMQAAAAAVPPRYVLPPEAAAPTARPKIVAPATPREQPGKPQLIALPQPGGDSLVLDPTGQSASLPPAAMASNVNAQATPVRAQPLPPADRFWVQLGVATNRAKLLSDWNRAAAKSGGGLAGFAPYLQPDIVKAQVVLRLVIGGYSDPSTAQALGSRLKASDVPVYVMRNALPADPLFP